MDDTRGALAGGWVASVTSASWNPTLIVTAPADKISGTYTGTITHSVA